VTTNDTMTVALLASTELATTKARLDGYQTPVMPLARRGEPQDVYGFQLP